MSALNRGTEKSFKLSKKSAAAFDLREEAEEDGGTERDAQVCSICMSTHVCVLLSEHKHCSAQPRLLTGLNNTGIMWGTF